MVLTIHILAKNHPLRGITFLHKSMAEGKFPISPTLHPLTESHQVLHTWLRPPYLLTPHLVKIAHGD